MLTKQLPSASLLKKIKKKQTESCCLFQTTCCISAIQTDKLLKDADDPQVSQTQEEEHGEMFTAWKPHIYRVRICLGACVRLTTPVLTEPAASQQTVCAQQDAAAAFLWHRMFFPCCQPPPSQLRLTPWTLTAGRWESGRSSGCRGGVEPLIGVWC